MILEVKDIHKHYAVERGIFKRETGNIHALHNINFQVEEFKTLGIIGESGCGKTTLAKIILKLIPPTSGEIIFDKTRIACFSKDVQIIFQNPYNSLNPKMRVYGLVSEPIIIHKLMAPGSIKKRVVDLLEMVGLDESVLKRRPIEFSGGQRQRICIARSLACEPNFLVLDEPISS
jgi:ABC-type glutathione transport system ATPase component